MIVVLGVVRSDEVFISAETSTPEYDIRNIDRRHDVMVSDEEDEDEKGLVVTRLQIGGTFFAIS